MDIIVGVITEVVKYLVSPFMDQVSYLVHYRRNANDLRKQITSLGELKADIQRSVDAADQRGEKIRVVVEGWLTKVNKMQSEEIALHNTLEESKGCLRGGCSGRYQVGKDAKHMLEEVKELLNEGQKLTTVSDPFPLPPGLEAMPTQDFQVYDSTKLAMDQIMNALNKKINMVGVYGIGGVGKTTLMKEVAKNLKSNGYFHQVVMVTVSQDPVFTKIQSEIAENLGLLLTQESLAVRARLLLERLKKEKQILIVLDDLWKPLNLLEQIGIPYGNNCKVVLTTRQLEVCTQMETQINIEVKVLSERDSWVMFKWAAGDCIEDDDMLHPVAKQITKECGGLPLAIITIGRALRAKGRSEWEYAASQFKKSGPSPPDIEGVHEKVFCSIKLSYDFLDSDATKFCLLLCCMFPEDYSISVDELLLYVVGEGVFGNNTSSLGEARNGLVTQMERLKRSCLLLDGSGREEGCVRMHDIIRDVSIWIASKEGHNFVVEAGRPLTNWRPDWETLKKCKRLSLMQCKISKLPNQLDCSLLTTLSLRHNRNLREIPDGFFQGMTSLKTLDLEGTPISSIPSSLSCLTDLRVLRIGTWMRRFSHLDVSLLVKLKNLEILQIQDSGVEKLPDGIGELSNLKSLSFSGNNRLTIAPNTLSRLSLLEELDLWDSFNNWQMEEGSKEEDSTVGNKVACLSEVAYLSTLSLTALNIWILNIECLSAINFSFRWENLTRFSVVFGREPQEFKGYDFEKCRTRVHIFGSMPTLSDRERMYLLERAEGLELNDISRGFKYVLSLGERGLNKLRILHVVDCDDVDEYVLSSSTTTTTVVPQLAFSNLEILYLKGLENLKAICNSQCHGSLPLESGSGGICFNNLRVLNVFRCGGLITIIPSDLLAKLPNLELLSVDGCSGATEVFNSKGLGLGQATMTKLRQLDLKFLFKVRTIWEGGLVSPLTLSNLEELKLNALGLSYMFSLALVRGLQQLKLIEIMHCEEMVQIISMENTQGFSSSTTLKLTSSSLLRPTPIFGNLRRLRIQECNKLKHILPMSVAQGLQQLEELEIYRCSNLEEIIVNDIGDDNVEEKDELTMCKTVLFPRLRNVTLCYLPKLSMVSKGLDFSWPSLETLSVKVCPNLKHLPILIGLQTTATKLRKIEWLNEYGMGPLMWDDPNKVLHYLRERGVESDTKQVFEEKTEPSIFRCW